MSARSLSVALVLLASCGDDRPEATLPEIDPRHSFLGPGTGEGRLVWTGAELGYATSRRFYRFTMDGEMLSDWALADRYPVSLDLTGENYGLIALDSEGVHLERFGTSGPIGEPIPVGDASVRATAEWNGVGYLLGTETRFESGLVMSRFDAVGQAVGAPATISFATAGELIWHGSGYFAVYRDDSYVIYFLELSSEAEPIGSTVVVSSSSFRPQVAWTGQELAIIVQQAPSLAWLLRVGPDGRRLADPLQLDFPCCAPDTFHAIDGGFVVASDEQAPHLAWLDSEGRLLERTPVGSGRRPVAEAVVWTGSEIGLIYSVLSDATTLDLVFQRVER